MVDFDLGFGFLVVENGGTRAKTNENAKNNETQNRVTSGGSRTPDLLRQKSNKFGAEGRGFDSRLE